MLKYFCTLSGQRKEAQALPRTVARYPRLSPGSHRMETVEDSFTHTPAPKQAMPPNPWKALGCSCTPQGTQAGDLALRRCALLQRTKPGEMLLITLDMDAFISWFLLLLL